MLPEASDAHVDGSNLKQTNALNFKNDKTYNDKCHNAGAIHHLCVVSRRSSLPTARDYRSRRPWKLTASEEGRGTTNGTLTNKTAIGCRTAVRAYCITHGP